MHFITNCISADLKMRLRDFIITFLIRSTKGKNLLSSYFFIPQHFLGCLQTVDDIPALRSLPNAIDLLDIRDIDGQEVVFGTSSATCDAAAQACSVLGYELGDMTESIRLSILGIC